MSTRPASASPALLDLFSRLEERGLAAHGRAVADLAVRVAASLALPRLLVERIELAALLHDAGKVELPQEVLDRRGPLTMADWRVIRSHPARSARLVGAIPAVASLAPWIRAHHERWDGRGYPDRLAGERIPLAARIIHACDAFDAMTCSRCYRSALPGDAACAEIAAGSGSQFDPVVARALVAAVLDT
jgi:HD-GYP domain-containing protein (c-di-GMP phosphodiesterase class II)